MTKAELKEVAHKLQQKEVDILRNILNELIEYEKIYRLFLDKTDLVKIHSVIEENRKLLETLEIH